MKTETLLVTNYTHFLLPTFDFWEELNTGSAFFKSKQPKEKKKNESEIVTFIKCVPTK